MEPLVVRKEESFLPWITMPSPVAASISTAAPENTSPVDPMVLFVSVCSLAVSTSVIAPSGRVAVVVLETTNDNGKLPEVENASAKETVLSSGMVSVPVVEVTVSPATFSALNA